VTSVTFSILGYGIEAFVFGYLGLTFFSYYDYEWSFTLFISEFFIVFIGRFIGIVGVVKFLELFGYKSGVSTKDLCFISYAGMIRGAVALGLVLKMPHSIKNRSVIITTCLSLVVFSTVFLGGTVALV
jgi:NhaP-type Na+/H+ or K+/H+ antiporter